MSLRKLFIFFIIFSIFPVFNTYAAEDIVMSETTECGEYITDFIGLNRKNSEFEVKKLQAFLSSKGFNLVVDGQFKAIDAAVVSEFQLIHKEDILDPWGIGKPTGMVYFTTKKKINELVCPNGSFSLNAAQISEIKAFKAPGEEDVDTEEVLIGVEPTDIDGPSLDNTSIIISIGKNILNSSLTATFLSLRAKVASASTIEAEEALFMGEGTSNAYRTYVLAILAIIFIVLLVYLTRRYGYLYSKRHKGHI